MIGHVKLTKVASPAVVAKSDNHSNESLLKIAHKKWTSFNIEIFNYFNKINHGKGKGSTQQQSNKPLLKYVFPKLTDNQMQYLRWGTIGTLLLLLVLLSAGLKFVKKPKGKQIW